MTVARGDQTRQPRTGHQPHTGQRRHPEQRPPESTAARRAHQPAPIRLSRLELASCYAALGIEPPYLLELTAPPGRTVADRDRTVDKALAGLAERGLTAPGGRLPAPSLAAALPLLSSPDRRLDIRYPDQNGAAVLGIGAISEPPTGHREPARAVTLTGPMANGTYELQIRRPSEVPGALLRPIGDIRPGQGSPVNLPADLLDQAVAATTDNSLWTLADELRRRGIAPAEATALARMCTGITAGARLGASRFGNGVEQRGGWTITAHRNTSGWFINLRRDNTVTVCPTDTALLLRQWSELTDSLRPAST